MAPDITQLCSDPVKNIFTPNSCSAAPCGAAGIQLEDQQLPKRCGHLAGKELVESAVMCEKLQAAVDARRNPDLVLVARTDARSVEGFEQAVARAQQYLAAGADWIFPEALASADEFARFEATPAVADDELLQAFRAVRRRALEGELEAALVLLKVEIGRAHV